MVWPRGSVLAGKVILGIVSRKSNISERVYLFNDIAIGIKEVLGGST